MGRGAGGRGLQWQWRRRRRRPAAKDQSQPDLVGVSAARVLGPGNLRERWGHTCGGCSPCWLPGNLVPYRVQYIRGVRVLICPVGLLPGRPQNRQLVESGVVCVGEYRCTWCCSRSSRAIRVTSFADLRCLRSFFPCHDARLSSLSLPKSTPFTHSHHPPRRPQPGRHVQVLLSEQESTVPRACGA